MSMPEYFRITMKSIKEEDNDAGGKTAIIEPLFNNKYVDFSNFNNLQSLAFIARKNANDLYELVMKKYRGANVADISNFEMLVALINLSSEIYMKCIIYFECLNEGTQCKKGHNLKAYFSKLPDKIKDELKSIDPDFDSKLNVISNYFNDFRYSFEFNNISANLFAFSLAEKLNEICNNLQIQEINEVIASNGIIKIR